jgi:phage-related protein
MAEGSNPGGPQGHWRRYQNSTVPTERGFPYGWPMGMPIVEKIENGLWAVRTKDLSVGIARTFFTVDNNLMILLHGIIKKSQKIPQQDLELARKRLSLLKG